MNEITDLLECQTPDFKAQINPKKKWKLNMSR